MLGPLGAVLAIPVTLLAKALMVDIDPATRWADLFLGGPPAEASAEDVEDDETAGEDA